MVSRGLGPAAFYLEGDAMIGGWVDPDQWGDTEWSIVFVLVLTGGLLALDVIARWLTRSRKRRKASRGLRIQDWIRRGR